MTRICGKIGLFFCTGLLLTFAAMVTAAGESIPPVEGKGDDGDRQRAGKALRETTTVPRAEEQEWLPAASDPAVEDFVFCRMFQLHRRMMRRIREKFNDAEFFQPESRLSEHPLFRDGGDDVSHLPLPPSPGWFLKESAEGYVLTLKPGNVIDKTLHVSVENAVLTISGETKSIREDSSGDRYFRERSYGSFQRCFTLPPGTDVEKIRAVEHDGVLTVTIPRRIECRKPENGGMSGAESGSCRNLLPLEPGAVEDEKSPVREFFHDWFDWFEEE